MLGGFLFIKYLILQGLLVPHHFVFSTVMSLFKGRHRSLLYAPALRNAQERTCRRYFPGTGIGGGGGSSGKPGGVGGAGGCHHRHPLTVMHPNAIITTTRNIRTIFIADPFFHGIVVGGATSSLSCSSVHISLADKNHLSTKIHETNEKRVVWGRTKLTH
jgi:hypothetical protein